MKNTKKRGCRPMKKGGCQDEGSGTLSVAAAVRHYGANYQERGQAERAYFAGLQTLNDAIMAAARSEDEDGNRLPHQRRLKQEAIRQATMALLNAADRLQDSADFDELFTLVEEAVSEIPGIGELFVYDVALRIGAWLELFPDKVYLHRGTRVGARALALDTSNGTLEMSVLPPELQQLPALQASCFTHGLQSKQTHKGVRSGFLRTLVRKLSPTKYSAIIAAQFTRPRGPTGGGEVGLSLAAARARCADDL